MHQGLSRREAARRLKQYGPNVLVDNTPRYAGFRAFLARFKNPLVIILVIAAILAAFFDDKTSSVIILAIVLLSVSLDFINSYRSGRAAEALKDRVRVKASVLRDGIVEEIKLADIVPGDVIQLTAGKVIPADGSVLEGKDLFANEAALTGESFPQGKPLHAKLFMGSAIVSGSGLMLVEKTSSHTKFAHIAKALTSQEQPTEFEREIRDFSLLIIKLTIALVVFVCIVNIVFHRPVFEAILFSLALAVGLTPELLPLIITLNLTKGSLKMARHGVIVKHLSAVQNFGNMDTLCTDKTGTLTEDHIKLVKYVDGLGKKSQHVLELGYISSKFSTSFQNPLDDALLSFGHIPASDYQKIDEIPFDFERKREAVVVTHIPKRQRFLIVKGAPEEIFKICKNYHDGKALHSAALTTIQHEYDKLSRDGFRVLAIASRSIASEKHYEPNDESNMTFEGFLAFLDPPKQSVIYALGLMEKLAIDIKIITGDNLLTTQKIASEINLPVKGAISGEQLAHMGRKQLIKAVEQNTIFARIDPEQKMRVIRALQANGHVIGYLGDGINDAPSLRAADVGVSVNNAVDVAKDAADFIMLRKNLHELILGVIEGRKTFANTLKYLRMGIGSNLGDMLSMAGASLFLPFLPLKATQILLDNILYDSSQITIPLDNVNEAEIARPKKLSMTEIKRFMWTYGSFSSFFDLLTIITLLLIFHANESSFQAGWFLESFITQVLAIFIIRTRLNPLKDLPGKALVASVSFIAILSVIIVLTPIRELFKFGTISFGMGLAITLLIIGYLTGTQLLKKQFYKDEV